MPSIEEHFEKQLDRINTWLSFAEAKNAALIVFDVAMLTIFADVYSKYTLFSTILIVIFLISGILCLYSFFPRLSSHLKPLKKNKTPKNLLSCAEIATISIVDSYIEQTKQRYYPTLEITTIKSNKIIDLASEILINSRITKQKYMLFRTALILDLVAFIIVIFLLIIALLR